MLFQTYKLSFGSYLHIGMICMIEVSGENVSSICLKIHTYNILIAVISSHLKIMFLVRISTFSFSPRDSTGGLGVKMVEYVLGGSPTNKESPLSNMESRLRGLKFDENDKVRVRRPFFILFRINI